MLAKEIMTRNPQCCTAADTLRNAARMMADNDCGCLPVVEEESKVVVGVLTDRDIAIRAVARGKAPDSKVNDIMSPAPVCCSPDDSVDRVKAIMAERRIRRVPVVDDGNRVVGIIAQADLARDNAAATDREVGRIVEKISEPLAQQRPMTRDVQPEQRI